MSAPAARATRLAIVTPAHTGGTGGSEFQIGCLLEVLATLERHEIYYLANSISADARPTHYRLIQIGDPARRSRLGYLTHAPRLYRALRELAPDVIYQRVACGYTGIAAHYAQRHGVRLVWHVASDSDVTPNRSLTGRNPLRRTLEKRSVEYGIRRASCIVTQTVHQSRLLAQHYGRSADAVIPNFHPHARERLDKSGRLTVAWIGSLMRWKQPEAFVRLASAWNGRPEVRFVMAGPFAAGSGERRWAEGLRERIAATPALEYVGTLTQDAVSELLARTHLLVNTSVWEGFPNTFIQAWMRDVAVVSLQVDPDGLLDSRGLGICCLGQEAHLKQAVSALLVDPALRAQYAARGREHALARHSLDNARALAGLLEPDHLLPRAGCAA